MKNIQSLAIATLIVFFTVSCKKETTIAKTEIAKTEIATENFKENNFENLKIFASHGTVDQVVPVDWARNSIPKIKELGIQIEYKEYPIGHGVSPQNFYDFKNWLTK